MDTTRNRAAVLARFLRAASADLARVARRVDDEAAAIRSEAIAAVDAVALELECVAARPPAPDPAREPHAQA